MAWQWSAAARRFRDSETGRFISRAEMLRLRDEFTTGRAGHMRDLTANMASGDLSIQRWELEMRQAIKSTHLVEYLQGRGGRNAMTPEDWGRLGQLIRAQYQFLHSFAQDVSDGRYVSADGEVLAAQLQARAALYAGAGTNSNAHGQESAWGFTLPVHPGDGGTPCLSNCRCHWQIVVTTTEYRAYWRLNAAAETCDGCLARAASYSPYTAPRA